MKIHYRAAVFTIASMALSGGLPVMAEGNPNAGKKLYQMCSGCHALAQNKTGPRHCGVIGRPAGTGKDFSYSSAMRQSGIVWDTANLDRFIASPATVVPGTKMNFAGLSDADKRQDLIAYLVKVSDNEKICSARRYKKSDK